MFKKMKGLSLILVFLALTMLALTGCSNAKDVLVRSEKSFITELAEETKELSLSLEVESAENESEIKEDEGYFAGMSRDWKDIDIKIDGIVYNFPYNYEKLNENGWHINLEEDGRMLEECEKILTSVKMYNDVYSYDGNNFFMKASFKNFDDEILHITECDLWSLEIDSFYGQQRFEDYPEVEIAQGITWGSTKEEIAEAFGEWDEIYENEETGFIKIDYTSQFSTYMTLTVHEEHGLTAVWFSRY